MAGELLYIPFSIIPGVGAFLLLRRREWRELAAVGLTMMLVFWGIGAYDLGRYSASCWPAFLPLGVWLSKQPNLQGPVVAVLALFQGLYFFLFAHQYNIT